MRGKSDLRKWAKEIRKNCNDCGEILSNKIAELEVYKNARHIMLFYPMKYEVNLLSLLNDSNKNFYLPRINGSELLVCPYKKGDTLLKSKYNTFEPLSKAVNKDILDVVIIPALCCDKNYCRLGYGGGFYDRFLADCASFKIACISKKLLVDTVFPEKYDIPMDLIVTD